MSEPLSINYCPQKVMEDFGDKEEMREICHRYSMTRKHSGEPELEVYLLFDEIYRLKKIIKRAHDESR